MRGITGLLFLAGFAAGLGVTGYKAYKSKGFPGLLFIVVPLIVLFFPWIQASPFYPRSAYLPLPLDMVLGMGALLFIYGIWIFALVVAFRKLSKNWAIFLGFLSFGIITSIFIVLPGRHEGMYFYNFPTTGLAEELHAWAYHHLLTNEEKESDIAARLIPWPFQYMQVYLLTSLVLWGGLGLIAQLVARIKY